MNLSDVARGIFRKENNEKQQEAVKITKSTRGKLLTYQIVTAMGISIGDLETSVRAAFKVDHLEIVDESSGCGENYAVFIVSPVSGFTSVSKHKLTKAQDFDGKSTLARHRLGTLSVLLSLVLNSWCA